jgi:hypothetical protein
VAVGRSMDRYTNLTENTSVNDVVRFYAQQGISINKVVDAHVWAERQLCHYSQVDDIARRAEDLQVMQHIRQYTNTEAQDELCVLVPVWWEATTPPQPMARPVVILPSMMTENATRPRHGLAFLHSLSRTSMMDYYSTTEESVTPYPSVAGPGPTRFTNGGWTGHVHPPKKKKAQKPKVSTSKKICHPPYLLLHNRSGTLCTMGSHYAQPKGKSLMTCPQFLPTRMSQAKMNSLRNSIGPS